LRIVKYEYRAFFPAIECVVPGKES
jgi:hypothetical protein